MLTLDTLLFFLWLTVLDPRSVVVPVGALVGNAIQRKAFDWPVQCGLAYLLLLVAVRLTPPLPLALHVGWWAALYPPKLDWREQIVLVTGSRGAVGTLLCEELGRRGAVVVGVDIGDAQPVDRPPEGHKMQHYYRCDVASAPAVADLAARVQADVGHPTVLVNNAGLVHGKPLLELEVGEIQSSVGVNHLAHFYLLKAFLPAMVARKTGSIVTVSSALGLIGAPGLTDYCSSKAALVGLHDSLERELLHVYKTPLIRPLLLLPAFIASPLFAGVNLPDSWLFRFGAPQLAVADVVDGVVRGVEGRRGGVTSMPAFVRLIPLVRPLPLLRELAQRLAGADGAMAGFRARRAGGRAGGGAEGGEGREEAERGSA